MAVFLNSSSASEVHTRPECWHDSSQYRAVALSWVQALRCRYRSASRPSAFERYQAVKKLNIRCHRPVQQARSRMSQRSQHMGGYSKTAGTSIDRYSGFGGKSCSLHTAQFALVDDLFDCTHHKLVRIGCERSEQTFTLLGNGNTVAVHSVAKMFILKFA